MTWSLITVTCPRCQREFETKSDSRRTTYCSRECVRQSIYARRRAETEAATPESKARALAARVAAAAARNPEAAARYGLNGQ